MIITTSRVRGPIRPPHVRSVQPSESVAAAGDPRRVDWQKWMDGTGDEPVPHARPDGRAPELAIVFRPRGSVAKELAGNRFPESRLSLRERSSFLGAKGDTDFRPAPQQDAACVAAPLPLMPGKGRIAGVAELVSAGTPQAAFGSARRKSRRGRRAADVKRLRRHTVIVVLRLI